MKDYIGQAIDLTRDKYLNPDGYIWNDGEGSHRREVNQITSISVHHDGTFRPKDYDSVGRYHTEAAEHYSRLGQGLQYFAKIDNVGQIYYIRPMTTWLNVVGSSENITTLAICLDGNFETQQPTREQFEALLQLLTQLCEQRPDIPATWPNVRPHRDYSATACCGANLRGYIYQIQDSTTARNYPEVPFDWPSLQPDFVVPTPPAVTPPPTVHPAPAPAPVVVPVTPDPTPPQPVTTTVAPQPEFVETEVKFPEGIREVLLKVDTAAIDVTGTHAPIHLSASRPYGTAGPFKSSSTFRSDGRHYYRGTSGSWYGVPAEDVASETTVRPPITSTPGVSWSMFLKDPLGVLIRLLLRKPISK